MIPSGKGQARRVLEYGDQYLLGLLRVLRRTGAYIGIPLSSVEISDPDIIYHNWSINFLTTSPMD